MLTDRSDARAQGTRQRSPGRIEGPRTPSDLEKVPPPAPRARRQPRDPRPEELALIRWLLDGPKPVLSGPIGRCVKRGWCDPLILDGPNGDRHGARVVYALTEEGRRLESEWRLFPNRS